MSLPATILIVDDIETNRKLLRAVLEAEGASIVTASDGVEALAVIERQKIDAVITDILMPRMDGFALCTEIRRSSRFGALPLVVYTSTYSSPADEKLAYLAGADKYIVKPAPTPVLLQALDEIRTEEKYSLPRGSRPPEEDVIVMREYNAALVRKLEERNQDLESARADLLRSNDQLHSRTAELAKLNRELEQRVHDRTRELEEANKSLDAFGRTLTHDLRSPLQRMLGFASLVERDCSGNLDSTTHGYIERIKRSAMHMNQIIIDVLRLTRVSTSELRRETVDMTALAKSIADELRHGEPQRRVDFVIMPGVSAQGDAGLLRIAFENLLGNAWKFTKKNDLAQIEFGVEQQGTEPAYYVRDNGVGFNMASVVRLFADFQRLHSSEEFPGTGVGLATVRRVIERHGGRIWATGAVNHGASFHFTLPAQLPS